ncbi:MAG: ABC transporter ATP-binding protein [Ruminiclostridium sp.]|nr:ABC transporter ATP-binding protein [Ruminiclostridium sp.]
MDNLLEIQNLTVELMSTRGIVYALSGVDLAVRPGEIHGIVGESGCGKSMTAKSILRLHNPQRSRMRGSIRFEGKELLDLSNREMEKLRGTEISMIFQDPMTSLNPIMTIGSQIADMYRIHTGASKAEAMEKAQELLAKVGIEPASKRCKQYPFELSGGMQQRVMIAMAIACSPKLLIADEPTTALDVTIQAQILELLQQLSADMGMSILLITHNFGVVAETCDRVSVMYAGKVVETGDTRELLQGASHPYSRALIRSIPGGGAKGSRLETIPGSPPALFEPPLSCMFAPRCPYAEDRCLKAYPAMADCGGGHLAACFKPLDKEVPAHV